MQLTKMLCSCALLAGAALAANNAALIKNDLNTLNGYLAQLTGDTNQFNSTATGIPFALQVQVDAVNIDKTLLNATKNAQTSDMLNDNDSFAIGVQLVAISNTVKQSLTTLKGKVTNFADLRPIVLNSLYGLRADTNSFAKALTAKLAPLEAGIAPGVTADLNNAFASAITTYGGKP